MELWTEYEGRTIDGAFSLEKLLLPEGRSAFFSTSNGKGEPTVIRLIASHFDEDEILARWRGVEALGHPNILKLERYGQLVLDGTTVVYAVMEPVDANLAEVISGQCLTTPEASQLAGSLCAALEILHANGFVHEHVEAANVFAVGEVVKLRGDCIREAPEGQKGLDAKRSDIHDVAVVLLQALTQQSTLEAATRELSLPAPFDLVVRNGMSGAWSLAEMGAALQTGERASAAATAAIPRSAVVQMEPRTAAGNHPAQSKMIESQAPESQARAKTEALAAESAETGRVSGRLPFLVEDREPENRSTGKWILAGAAVILLLLIWLFIHHRSAGPNSTAQQAPSPATQGLSSQTPLAPTASKANAGKASAGPRAGKTAASLAGVHEQWRVVAYTYNREDQARKKVATIAQKHAGLTPDVFSPTGRAPYLVTIGGAMSRDEAFAFVQKARNQGLPRDTYAQNYGGKRR